MFNYKNYIKQFRYRCLVITHLCQYLLLLLKFFKITVEYNFHKLQFLGLGHK